MEEIRIRIIIVSVLVLLALINWFIPGIFSGILLLFALVAMFGKITTTYNLTDEDDEY